jgi:1-phosphatidylinositol phosphodiesterase
MGALPDASPLHKLSIPGTHDTAARYMGVAYQTQSWSIPDQLEAGIRYLDIRTRRVRGNGTRQLAIHHADVFEHIWFDEVMNQVIAFLRAHPREVVIMRVRGNEKDPEAGARSYPEIWPAYLQAFGSHIANINNPLPTLGELRGKVYILDDGASLPNHGAAWSNPKTHVQDNYYVWAFLHDWVSGYNASLPSKRKLVDQFIDEAGAPSNDRWVFNHLSGAGAMAPRDVAHSTNAAAFGHIGPYSGKKVVGTIIMDFPGEELVYRVVHTNFQAQVACAPKTFRAQSEHSWVEFHLPQGIDGQAIAIPSGAYNHYVFPKCNRVHWDDVTFYCARGAWERTHGSWDSDAMCHGDVPQSPYIRTGTR